MVNFLSGSFLIWLPNIFFGAFFLVVAFLYFFRDKFREKLPEFYKVSFLGVIGFRIFYAVLLSIAQYFTWSKGEFTKIFTYAPAEKSAFFNYKYGYFLHYISTHFWINVLISIGAAFAFYLFLIFLKKCRERFFEEGEVELGFAIALIAGWPNFIIFIPMVFIFIVLTSISRELVFKKMYTTLGWPLLLAALATLIWGDKLVQFLQLGVLKI